MKVSTAQLQGVAETLLPVLYSRVVESRLADAIFQDPIAIEWVSQIDYDFSKFERSEQNNLGVAIRTEILDDYARAFISEHPQATVVNVAAGLDTRFFRMDNGQLRWYELDFPEVIAVRRQLMTETERHQCIAGDALDRAWLSQISHQGKVLFIVEGLLMYFTEAQVQQFLRNVADAFPSAELLLEVIGVSQAQRTHLNDAISQTNASFKWGIRDVEMMAQWHPTLNYLEDTSIYDRYEARWLALPLPWKDRPSAYRNATDRIVRMRVNNS